MRLENIEENRLRLTRRIRHVRVTLRRLVGLLERGMRFEMLQQDVIPARAIDPSLTRIRIEVRRAYVERHGIATGRGYIR